MCEGRSVKVGMDLPIWLTTPMGICEKLKLWK
jgi:hypothetical protein